MSTIGEQVLARIDAVERRMGLMERNGIGAEGRPVDLEQMRTDIADIRTRMDAIPNPAGPDGTTRPQWSSNPKEWLPENLSQNYKELWRVWSYKTREWLSQYDASLAV